jgi:hypothetical protein
MNKSCYHQNEAEPERSFKALFSRGLPYPLKSRTGLINRRAPMPRCTHPANQAKVSEFRTDGRQPGHYTRFGVTSGWAVTRPELWIAASDSQ